MAGGVRPLRVGGDGAWSAIHLNRAAAVCQSRETPTHKVLRLPRGAAHAMKVGSSSTKEYWYLRGVGKLKETGTQTEELTEYQLEATP